MSVQNILKREKAAAAKANIKAKALALKTADAYSADRYGEAEWVRCADFLLSLDISARDVEIILRSKVMRWAADEFTTEWDDDRDYPTVDCLIQAMTKWNRPFSGLGLRSASGLRHA